MKKLISVLIGTLLSSSVLAHSLDPMYADISNEYNLIGFPYLAIKEVIGDKSKFEILPRLASKEIALLPKARLGERLDITLITSTGVTKQLALTVKDMAPVRLLIEAPLPHKLLEVKPVPLAEQVDHFLQRILENRVQLEPAQNPQEKLRYKNLCLNLIGKFATPSLQAQLFNVNNLSNRSIELNKECFVDYFPNALEIYLPKQFLQPRETIQIIVIYGKSR